MIQDLIDLSEIGRENPEPLKAISFDMNKIELAAQKSKEMGELRGQARADNAEDNKTKLIRDKAYTHLKEAVDEIRACGQYLFWKDDNRRKGYAGKHYRAQNAAKKTETDLTATN
ncbi:MAG: hypothetical protein JXR91_13725 [Deltaproteobacteria bacterium]|nr:hypothetical protein [Deltaproteobacteria bacterium]